MSALVDTNVLLRRSQPDHTLYSIAVESVAQLLATGEPVFFTLQNIAEFWNVVTRPAESNGFGLPPSVATAEVEKIKRLLTLLPDVPAIYPEWKRLVTRHAVAGVKVHDARLVAAMNVHGVQRLLTFDPGDFIRYGIQILQPASLLS